MITDLTLKQRLFVTEYCVDENATQAAIRAGYSKETAAQIGSENLTKPHIRAAIEERMKDVAVAAGAKPEMIVRHWLELANADPSEISRIHRGCCRYCYGYDHQYQWTEGEYFRAVNFAIDAGKAAPDGMGGFGYDAKRQPAPDCPECSGLGVETAFFEDTRNLTGAAKRLYAGVKVTSRGTEVLMRDQDKALENLSRYLGMLVDKKEVSGPGGKPLAIVNISADELTDDQLIAMLNGLDNAESTRDTDSADSET